jgi:hypothetical protein
MQAASTFVAPGHRPERRGREGEREREPDREREREIQRETEKKRKGGIQQRVRAAYTQTNKTQALNLHTSRVKYRVDIQAARWEKASSQRVGARERAREQRESSKSGRETSAYCDRSANMLPFSSNCIPKTILRKKKTLFCKRQADSMRSGHGPGRGQQ